MAVIYHLVPKAEWESVKLAPEYRAASLESEGFIHCSKDEKQMLEVANRRFSGRRDMLVLDVDTELLKSAVKDERASSGGIYPHIYGPLNTSAIRMARPLMVDANGKFSIYQGN